jgi:Flp pilus assembly pilin Flp
MFRILFAKLLADRKGQDLIEYALMAGFLAAIAVGTLPDASTTFSSIFGEVSSALSAAGNLGPQQTF